jgi:hypothetical protein
VVILGLTALVASACQTDPSSDVAAPSATTTTTAPPVDAAGTVWLCRPGLAQDPCDGDLSATTVTAGGKRHVESDGVGSRQKYNCFYLYPTASNEPTVNADLTVQSTETDDAIAQAARFSKVCNVWAPMYRQVTVSGLSQANTTDPGAYQVAYDSVLADWTDFITNFDNGLPIVFIGHSQGSVMLIKLLQAQVDTDPSLRKLLVAAIIAGGNVTVPTGQAVGGTFQDLPLCSSSQRSGCVIAYSSFPTEPPADANFGRPGQGISLNTGQTATSGVQVACVNPAAIGGGTASLSTYWPVVTPLPIPSMVPPPPSVTTPWLYYPHQYSATCENDDGASWLQVTPTGVKGDTRPLVTEIAGPSWGYHFQDINLALGNLVTDVHDAELSYRV